MKHLLPLAAVLFVATIASVGWTAEATSDAKPALVGAPRDGKDHLPPPLSDLGKANKVRVVYLIPSDREPAKEFHAKIEVLLAFVRDVYRRDLLAKGYKSDGPDFVFEEGRLKVHLIKTDKPASHYNFEPNYTNQPKVFDRIMPDVEAELGPMSDNFYFVLAETYAFGPYDYEWPGNFALGGYRSARGGAGAFSSWILRDELCATTIEQQLKLLEDGTPIEGRTALGHGRPNSPRFEFIEDGFGAVCHELGHAFGCPHDARQNDNHIMANGFRRFRVNYLGDFSEQPPMCFSTDNARFLASSRFLNDEADVTDDKAPVLTISHPVKLAKDTTRIPVKVKATDDKGLSAMLFYTSQGDTVRGGRKLEGTEQEFEYEIVVDKLQPGELRLLAHVVDRGGNIAVAVAKIAVEE